jgi:hypothetical protein
VISKDLKVIVPSLVGPQVINTGSMDSANKSNKRKPNETDQVIIFFGLGKLLAFVSICL